MWVPWRVICHSKSWQKGEEEVDELHNVDTDQEAASSLSRAKNSKCLGKEALRLAGNI